MVSFSHSDEEKYFRTIVERKGKPINHLSYLEIRYSTQVTSFESIESPACAWTGYSDLYGVLVEYTSSRKSTVDVRFDRHGIVKLSMLWDVSGVYLYFLICSHCYVVNTKLRSWNKGSIWFHRHHSLSPIVNSSLIFSSERKNREVDTLSLTTLIIKYMTHPNPLMKLGSCLFNRPNLLFAQIRNMFCI